MRSFRALLLGLIAATASFAFASSATAATLTLNTSTTNLISNATNTTIFQGAFGVNISCTFTLRGTFSTSIVAPTGTLTNIGAITGVTGGPLFPCSGGSSVSFSNFPWTVQGRVDLPSVSVQLNVNGRFTLLNLPLGCGTQTYAGQFIGRNTNAGNPRTISTLSVSGGPITPISGNGFCAGSVTGSAALSPGVGITLIL